MNKVAKISRVIILAIILTLTLLSGGFNEGLIKLIMYACLALSAVYTSSDLALLFIRLLWKEGK
jgi:hypothetical protein